MFRWMSLPMMSLCSDSWMLIFQRRVNLFSKKHLFCVHVPELLLQKKKWKFLFCSSILIFLFLVFAVKSTLQIRLFCGEKLKLLALKSYRRVILFLHRYIFIHMKESTSIKELINAEMLEQTPSFRV